MAIIAKKGGCINDDDWDAATYEDIMDKYHHKNVKDYPPMYPVDILAIATRDDPVPIKDLERKLTDTWHGKYLGISNFVSALQRDTFKCTLNRKN